MNMQRQIIVIIDPQNDFTNVEGCYAKKHSGITQILKAKENINTLLNFQTNDKCVIIRSDYKVDQFEKGLAICIPNTFGHEIDITYNNTLNIFSKTEHSCFTSESFKQHLRNNEIETLILCGFL